jgi:hypothetical protein
MVIPFSVYCDCDKVLAEYGRDVSDVQKKIAILMKLLSTALVMAVQGVCNEPSSDKRDKCAHEIIFCSRTAEDDF